MRILTWLITAGLALNTLAFAQEFLVTERALPPSHRFDLAADRGSVRISGWDQEVVSVRAEHPSGVRIEIKGSAELVEVRQFRDPGAALAGGVTYSIHLPRQTAVHVATIDAPVSVRGLEAAVDVITDRGAITVEEIQGSVLADTTVANIILHAVSGDVSLDATRGELEIRDLTGELTAQTVGGSVRMEGVDSPRVSVTSQAGDIEFSGTIQALGYYQLASIDGTLTLDLPTDVSATITAGTVRGLVQSDFGTGGTEPEPGSSLTFSLNGGGGATLSLVTERGDIRLRRRESRSAQPPPAGRTKPDGPPPV